MDYKTHVSQFEIDRYLGVAVTQSESGTLLVVGDQISTELARTPTSQAYMAWHLFLRSIALNNS